MQALISANYPSYTAERWHLTLIMFALLIVCGLINHYAFWTVPWIELVSGILHVVLFIIFVAVLTSTSKTTSTSEFVFLEGSTSGGWQSSFVSFNIGMSESSIRIISAKLILKPCRSPRASMGVYW